GASGGSESLATQAEGLLPILISLTTYTGQYIGEMVLQAFGLAGLDATGETVGTLARKGLLYLLLDDYDAVPANHMPNLLASIRTWRQTYPANRFVLATRRPRDGHILGMPTFNVCPLRGHQATEFLQSIGMSAQDALAVSEG